VTYASGADGRPAREVHRGGFGLTWVSGCRVEMLHVSLLGDDPGVRQRGLIDEFSIALSPVLSGSGIRLFEGVDAARVALKPVRAEPTQRVTHLTYAVR
jgi:hypothetical protein